MLEEIKQKEDEIFTLSKDLRPGMKVPSEMSVELVDLLTHFYHSFPDNASAPVCLDRIKSILSPIQK